MGRNVRNIPSVYSSQPVLYGVFLFGFDMGSLKFKPDHEYWIFRELPDFIRNRADVMIDIQSFSSESQNVALGRVAEAVRMVKRVNPNCKLRVYAQYIALPNSEDGMYIRVFSANAFAASPPSQYIDASEGMPNWFVKNLSLSGGGMGAGPLSLLSELGLGIECSIGKLELESIGGGPPFNGLICYGGISVGKEIKANIISNNVIIKKLHPFLEKVEKVLGGGNSINKAGVGIQFSELPTFHTIGMAFGARGGALDNTKFHGPCLIFAIQSSAIAASVQMYIIFFGISPNIKTILNLHIALGQAVADIQTGGLASKILMAENCGLDNLLTAASNLCKGFMIVSTAGLGFNSAGITGSIFLGDVLKG